MVEGQKAYRHCQDQGQGNERDSVAHRRDRAAISQEGWLVARVHLIKTLNGFVVADEESRELARKFKTGEVYRADIVKPRNYKSLKLFQALVSLTYSNLPERYHQLWPTPRQFRRMLADAVGHVEEFTTQDGERK